MLEHMFDVATVDENEVADGPATPGALLGACADAAVHAVEVASAVPVGSLDGPELRALTLQLEHTRALLDAAEAHALAELDRRRHTDIRLGATTSKWLAHHANLPAAVARA